MFHYQNFYAPDGSRVNEAALPTPVTTKEQYMYARATGGSTEGLPTPVSSEEQYMKYLMDNGANLPVPTVEDAGKAVVVDENGGYALGSGSGGGVFVVHDNDGTLDKTWSEINVACGSGLVVMGADIPIRQGSAWYLLACASDPREGYTLVFQTLNGYEYGYASENADGYPMHS